MQHERKKLLNRGIGSLFLKIIGIKAYFVKKVKKIVDNLKIREMF